MDSAPEPLIMSVVGQTYTITYECNSGNDYDGRLGIRISSIFVIGFGSLCGMSFIFRRCHLSACRLMRFRSIITNYGRPDEPYAGAACSILHNEVFWIWSHYSYCFYTCEQCFTSVVSRNALRGNDQIAVARNYAFRLIVLFE